MKNKMTFCVIFTFLFLSCYKEKIKDKEQDMYGILNILVNKYKHSNISPIFLPANNPYFKKNFKKFDIKDSLFSYKFFHEKISGKNIIAINKKMTNAHLNVKQINCLENNLNLFNELTIPEDLKEIDLTKIVLNPKKREFEKDSVIYYDEKFNLLKSKDFPKEFNIVFNFSNIVFDKEHKKAFVVLALSYSRLSGFSKLIYLEKKNYHWEIKCEKGLSIS